MSTKEKQNFRIFICLALLLLLASSIIFVPFLITKNTYAETANRLEISDFISYSEQDNEYKSFISKENLAQLKSDLEKNKTPKDEIYKEVYRELGYSDDEIKKIGVDEINLIMETSIAITVSQQYLSVDENGNQKVLSKEEGLRTANAINSKQELELQEKFLQIQNNQVSSQENSGIAMAAATSGNNGFNEEIKGIMKITTRSDYINPKTENNEKGWYNFSSITNVTNVTNVTNGDGRLRNNR